MLYAFVRRCTTLYDVALSSSKVVPHKLLRGAIIKKGGLGVPVIVSIIFFIIFYITTIMGEKYAKEMVISPVVGCWAANVILLAFGLFFLKQARKDARLFDTDFYYVFYQNLSGKIKSYFGKKKGNTESLSASSD